MTKTLAPGYRVGWAAAGRFKIQVERLKFMSSIATATLPQLAIAEFLRNGGYDHHLRKIRKAYSTQVQLMRQAISEYFPEGTCVTRPSGGFVLWVELPKGVNSLKLHQLALKERIGVAPGPLFSAKNRFQNYIRLSCGHPWSPRLEHALVTLGRLIRSM